MPLRHKVDNTTKVPRKRGPRFTNAQRQDIMTCVSVMRRRGYLQHEIAETLGLSQRMVCHYLMQIDDHYKTLMVAEAHVGRQEKLDQYNELVKEAYEAWERSQEDYEQVVTDEEPRTRCPACKGTKTVLHKATQVKVACQKCKGRGMLGGIISTSHTRRGQVGDPRFLQILKGIHDSVCDLLGLNLGNKGGNTLNVLNWDQVAGESSKPRPMPLGSDKLAALESLPPAPAKPQEPSQPTTTPESTSEAAVIDSSLSPGKAAPGGAGVDPQQGGNGTAKSNGVPKPGKRRYR